MASESQRDVMQVCRHGHVITDLLRSQPGLGRSHCERCGSTTISRCPTCGHDLPGAVPVPGLQPIGERRAPTHCPCCGAAFPWAGEPPPSELAALLDKLERLLRRLPQAARQLRDRHGSRPTLVVEDIFDLQDLLRCALHLSYDDVRRETRTPRYALATRTDFALPGPIPVALTAKLVTSAFTEPQLTAEMEEDITYYDRPVGQSCLVCLLYDPGQHLPRPEQLEVAWQRTCGDLYVRCVVAR